MADPMEIDISNNADLIDSVDTFIFDCDGVLWNEHGQAINGAVDAVNHLRAIGKKVFFISNNSSKTRADYAARCSNLGFTAVEDEIIGTAWLAAAYLRDVKEFEGKVYLVGGDALAKEFEAKDIKFIGNGEEKYRNDYGGLLSTELDPEVNAVVVGFDPYINFPKVLKAASYLQRDNCLFLATNMDSFLPTTGPIRFPGTGSIVQFVKYAAEREPIVLGKPETLARDILAKTHSISSNRTVMVGDRLDTDMLFGANCGFRTVLVLSGAAKLSDIEKHRQTLGREKCIPQYYMQSVRNLL